MRTALKIILPLLGGRRAASQIFVGSNSSQSLFPIAIGIPAGLSDGCTQSFNTTVTCDGVLPAIAFAGHFPSAAELDSLCTAGCSQSLQALRSNQLAVCKTQQVVISGQSFPATSNLDHLLWSYSLICRKDEISGDWCSPIVDNWASNQTSSDETTACSDCVLGSLQSQLESPFGSSQELQDQFSALTSSCKATGYEAASPTSYMDSPGNLTQNSRNWNDTSSACLGHYTVKAGDDCHSISKSQRVSTALMLYTNGLEGHCTNFPAAGEELCMPHQCDLYTVQANDTCWGISQILNNAVAISQLVSWNVDINRNCDNLDQLVGNQICISFPGDISSVTAAAAVPMATAAPVPSNVANGTNSQCGKYYSVTTGDTCASVTQQLGISLSDFYFLNPEINATSCDNLLLDYSYCVKAVGDIQTYSGHGGVLGNSCVGRSTTGPSSCYATTYSTGPVWNFPNPTSSSGSSTSGQISTRTVGPSSTSIVPQNIASTASTKPTQTGMVTGCQDFYLVAQGDTCAAIASKYNIQLAQFYAWNSAIGNGCQNLLSGIDVCVGMTVSPNPTASGKVSARSVNSDSKTADKITVGDANGNAVGALLSRPVTNSVKEAGAAMRAVGFKHDHNHKLRSRFVAVWEKPHR